MTTRRLFTIGFTQTTAQNFFERLRRNQVRQVLDIRRNNVSQLAGFAKCDDLAFFLRELASIDYQHLPNLAPTQAMLDAYRKQKGSWDTFAECYMHRLQSEDIAESLGLEQISGACLLCSEAKPHHCHRRLLGEYLARRFPEIVLVHL